MKYFNPNQPTRGLLFATLPCIYALAYLFPHFHFTYYDYDISILCIHMKNT